MGALSQPQVEIRICQHRTRQVAASRKPPAERGVQVGFGRGTAPACLSVGRTDDLRQTPPDGETSRPAMTMEQCLK
jgi:hypothetical protein